MIILQLVLAVLVPVVMLAAGRVIKRKSAEYLCGGLAYKSKFAKKTPETWAYANTFFAQMLFAIGVNVTVISAAFMAAVVFLTDANGWLLALVLVVIQLVCCMIPVGMTEMFMKKLFDEEGIIKRSSDDKENNI